MMSMITQNAFLWKTIPKSTGLVDAKQTMSFSLQEFQHHPDEIENLLYDLR